MKANQFKKECFFCEKPGHFKKDCFQYKKWKAGKEGQSKAKIATEKHEIEDEFLFMVKVEDAAIKESCLGVNEENKCDFWYVDSGASSHMCSSRQFFSEFNSKGTGFVQLADSSKKSEVKGIGSGILNCIIDNKVIKVKVRDVLYVLSFGSNLLSVKKLNEEGFEVTFKDNNCKIIKSGRVVACARLGKGKEDLYSLETAVEKAYTAINNEQGDNCQHAWHGRFEHRDLSAINELAAKGLSTGIIINNCGRKEICECCVKGKMTGQPFPKENTIKSKETLELIHTDVCGPMQTLTPRK